jgi:hypothetical protein
MGSTRGPGRIIVVYNENPSLVKGLPKNMLAKQGVIACSQAVTEALVRRYEVQRVPIRAEVEVALAPYPPTEWAVFNLGEGIEGRLFEEAHRLGAGGDGLPHHRLARRRAGALHPQGICQAVVHARRHPKPRPGALPYHPRWKTGSASR